MRVSPAVNARTSQKKEHDVNFSSPFCCWQPAVGKFAKFSRHGKLLRRYTTLGTILFGETSSYVSACGTIDHLGTQGCMMRFCKSEKDSGFRPDSASLPRQPRRSPAPSLLLRWIGTWLMHMAKLAHLTLLASNVLVEVMAWYLCTNKKAQKIGILLTDGYCCQRKNV